MTRDAGLDLVKWLAMLSMLIDHLRYLWPDVYALFVIGRLAFPLFCLGIAANVVRTRPGELFNEGNARYLGSLLAFSLLSEMPYRLLSPESATLNVMPTLSLGLLVAWGVHHADRNSLLLTVGTLAIALLLHRQLMYGVIGVMLPAAFVIGLKAVRWWPLPVALAVLANSRNRWLVEWGIVPETLAMLAMAGGAVVLGLALLRQPMPCTVWPVGRWGYWFYPGHLAAIYLIKP
ncbi:conjugal transfer protein TraX [Ectopseudomonas composti]|jgi:hypothetical protein|uniref:TraX family protein n=1 Tax=Ectopseudomonas mendocina TaxID=300 RepID=A0A379IV23_ECTME|nr:MULTISPECIES: TraX family protein [Pseudomonas]MBJ7546405.1 conjugal transfer protein TraX [Pseudomonas sp. OA3]RPY88573.1 conjugal transfer protein TraX [Pseudomonas aeruginosa]RRV29514.1 conjugal transfer protein TraX [Pseudomonas sp. o96-267]WOA84713.1 TraX family protein [Pseudomonas aeruginosa]SUD40095.1 TraX family protein [Pseudomonas mendocina]